MIKEKKKTVVKLSKTPTTNIYTASTPSFDSRAGKHHTGVG